MANLTVVKPQTYYQNVNGKVIPVSTTTTQSMPAASGAAVNAGGSGGNAVSKSLSKVVSGTKAAKTTTNAATKGVSNTNLSPYTGKYEDPFSYDLNADALYQQYKNRYTQNARMAMKDTMGQAASLTGGYGSTYGQAVGQQAYDRTMMGLTDLIPELEQSAYTKWKDAGDRARQDEQAAIAEQQRQLENQRYAYDTLANLISTTGYAANAQELAAAGMGADQAKALKNTWSTNQAATNYKNLSSMITSTGYEPSADDLKKANMTKAEANALRQAWMAANPTVAYYQGAMTAEQFKKLTGEYPVGYTPPATGGSGGNYGSPSNNGNNKNYLIEYVGKKVADVGSQVAANTGKSIINKWFGK